MANCTLMEIGNDTFMPATTHTILDQEIGAWTGKVAHISLGLAYLPMNYHVSVVGSDLPPFWIQTEEYEPKQKELGFESYTFQDGTRCSLPRWGRQALKHVSGLDVEKLLDWAVMLLDRLLQHSRSWYCFFALQKTIASYVQDERQDVSTGSHCDEVC